MHPIRSFQLIIIAIFLALGGSNVYAAAAAAEGAKELVEPQSEQSEAKKDAPEQTENAGSEQAHFPGIKNELLKLGGNGAPAVSIFYPSFANSKVDPVFREFAERVGRSYLKDLDETYSEGGEKPDNYDQWEMNGFFTADRPNPDIASITFNIYSYTGGAHGDLFVDVMNYDLKTGEQIKFRDMFSNPDEAIAIFSRLAPAKLRKALGEGDIEEEMLQDGTAPSETNFSQLSLNPDGLAVEFQPYQVGPWAIGQQHVDFTLEELMPAGPNPQIWPSIAKD